MKQRAHIHAIVAFAFLSVAWGAIAQQETQSSTYFLSPLPFNPAYSGLSNQLNVRSLTRVQWVGWGGAPATQMVSVDAPLLRKFAGLGLTVTQDRVGARSSSTAMASGAAHVKLSEDWTLSMGISGGMRFHSYDFRNLRADATSDDLYQVTFQNWAPGFGAGFFATSEGAYLGYSVPQILTQALSDSANADDLQRHHYVMGGLKKEVATGVNVQYGALLKATADAPPALDLQATIQYHDEVGVGGHLRWGESVGLLLSLKLSEAISAVYLMEMPFNRLRTQNLGTHELALRWNVQSPQVVANSRFF
jgi:type IX secretion system PorP/SprF family membrane protein